MTWCVVFTKQAQQDAYSLVSSGLKDKAQTLFVVVDVVQPEHTVKVLRMWTHYE